MQPHKLGQNKILSTKQFKKCSFKNTTLSNSSKDLLIFIHSFIYLPAWLFIYLFVSCLFDLNKTL